MPIAADTVKTAWKDPLALEISASHPRYQVSAGFQDNSDLFERSLRHKLLSGIEESVTVYLNGMSNLRIPDLAPAASAGLLQDIGLPHIAPGILAPGKALPEAAILAPGLWGL